jgi:peptidoglycan/LPS O-acetylase OafA/YrhL
MSDAASAYLDALRALGANLVIASHVLALYFGIRDPFGLGNLGVAVFFLLSGFLIMQSMLSRAQRPGPALPGFLADRAARILTPYVPALVLIAAANAFVIRGNYGADGSNVGALAFLGNLFLLQDHSAFQFLDLAGIHLPWRIRPYNAAEPFWTVAIEMWIYVAVGLFFFCLLRRERIEWRHGALLALVSFPVVIWNAAAGGGQSLTLIWLLGAIFGLLFDLWRKAGYANLRVVATAVVVFGGIALAGRSLKAGFHPFDFQTATLLAMVMFGVLALLVRARTIASPLKHTATFLASYSYSLYLIHNTVLIVVFESITIDNTWARVTLAVILAHVCSYALYLACERHYRSVGRWLRPKFEHALAAPAVDLSSDEPAAAARQER